MKIKDIRPGMGIDIIEATIKELKEIREFSRFGKAGKVREAIIEDDTGEISLVLWDEMAEMFAAGDRLAITNAYAKEYRGSLQIGLGKEATIEKK
jgi:replication factor A1